MPILGNEQIMMKYISVLDVIKEMHNILILTEDKVYWEVWLWKGDYTQESGEDFGHKSENSQFVGKEFYCYPYVDLAFIKTDGKSLAKIIEDLLWVKTEEIKNMPEDTPELAAIKNMFRKPFSYRLG